MTTDPYLQATHFLDAEHPAIRAFAADAVGGATDSIEAAVRLYYAVRDGLRYDPYSVELSPDGLVASNVLARGRGYCVAKAGVLAAAARAIAIPSRLGFADVRNHLATPRLLEMMGTDIFYYHGYTELRLENRWVKATPAFNVQLCERFGVEPLEFDGRADSIFHPYDTGGRRHMEYVHDRGTRDDMPIEELREAMTKFYPRMTIAAPGGDFHAEAEADAVARRNAGER
ncbi:MAG TPA: transglutaminase family protein [Candidatus Binatia bacterium]|nr:transglutaminase family protein [Candidatus Binatia bacterium]